ncbi:phenylacetate--CoA ligase family protein [Actinoplanes palleronii]|uniref:Adenylyltransferase n=1 Tax=Actinoplanes palleronii TaxID=113570 RepID=A0ABQ4BP07_9ACTN|nr:phenylacetate--CoA ligase family protein [Actinoplanes palleronii]GIE72342.1 adenylyltransferase [Actinoplanes palleronii]
MFLREALDIPVTMVRQYASRQAITRRKLRWINEMLVYSRERVPYYREDPLYQHGPLRDLAELADLPILRKATLRERPLEDMIAEGVPAERCRQFQTSGSTGQRVTIRHDQRSHDYHMAACFRRFAATGRYRPTDRLTHVRPYVAPTRSFEKLGLFRRHTILSHRPMAEIKAELLGNRPHVLAGQPVHMREVLRALTPPEMAQLRKTLRMVLTESELLTDEHRARLVEGYGVPVFDEYSAFEILNIYFECPAGGRHIAEDRIHVEVVDDDGHPLPAGQEGRLIITPYMERAMPLLRYELGDIGVLGTEPCRCGRAFGTLRLTKGRANDYVILPDGRRLYPDTFVWFAAVHADIAECFVEQDKQGRVRLNIVPMDGVTDLDSVFAGVREEMFRLAAGPFDLEVVRADRLPLTVGGKGKFITSEYSVDA